METQKRIRALVVEDDFLVSQGVSRIIKEIGHDHIGTATDGEQAVEMTVALEPDVVIMDIEMPKMDGLEAARQIQARCPTPIVILTAHESRDLYDRASEAGVGVYLTKPTIPEELDRAITLVIARHEDLMTSRRLYEELVTKTKELEKALKEVKTLRGIIPICMKCHRIRNDDGYWHRVEVYLTEHTEAEFSHGLCTRCCEEEKKKAE